MALFGLINSHHTPLWDVFFLTVTRLGNSWVLIPGLALTLVWRVPRSRLLKVMLVSALAVGASGLVDVAIKETVKTPRPWQYFDSGKAPNPVHIVGRMYRNHRSFPSGHTNTAFLGALVLGMALGGWWWSAFIPALLVAYSRVYVGAHFPLDCLGGALVAFVVAGPILWVGLRSGSRGEVQPGSVPPA
jgi:undecaprenyl-diphosphatase